MKLPLIGVLGLLLLTAACASSTSFGDVRSELPKQLGYMLYEEAVEYYGKPATVVHHGERFTAEWVHEGLIIIERLKLTFDQRQIMRAYDYNESVFK